jgi:Protein of unknown function (DUF3311).
MNGLRLRRVLWLLIGGVLIAAAVPWWLWGAPLRWGPLPVYVWYHIGWMGIVTLVFAHFARRWWEPLGAIGDGEADAD